MPQDVGSITDIFSLLGVSFLAIAAYNTIELLFWIFGFFKRWQGLYFWSILTATVCVGSFMIIATLLNFQKAPMIVCGTGVALVYPYLLTAQVLVLYSRLHLVTQGHQRFLAADRFIERSMIIAPIGRELFICGICIYEAMRQLQPIMAVKGRAGRKVMLHLIFVFGAVIVLDGLICVVHSIELKMEFGILNKLLEMLAAPVDGHRGPSRSLPELNRQEDSLVGMMHVTSSTGTGEAPLAFRVHECYISS
ncbi:hypothetical protein BDW62DRAFT_214745 [Aspergillus aurantiobrunneus]